MQRAREQLRQRDLDGVEKPAAALWVLDLLDGLPGRHREGECIVWIEIHGRRLGRILDDAELMLPPLLVNGAVDGQVLRCLPSRLGEIGQIPA
jgi:hypothetical protein